MKRYSDDWLCPKCGHRDGWPDWKGELVTEIDGTINQVPGPMLVHCERCGYAEEVLPLDAEAEEESDAPGGDGR